MKSSYLLFLLFLYELEISPVSLHGEAHPASVIYYVKPSQSGKCPGHPCETFRFYLQNVDTTINQEKNLSMIFLRGRHATGKPVHTMITTPIIRMMGASEEVIVSELYYLMFYQNIEVHFKSLVIEKWLVVLMGSSEMQTAFLMFSVKLFESTLQLELIYQARIESSVIEDCKIVLPQNSTLKLCEFRNVSMPNTALRQELKIQDCNLFRTPLKVSLGGNVIFSGTTVLAASYQASAIFSYSSNITLSGAITFANNSGVRGGAIAMYFSNINIATNTKLNFINNSAIQQGGAIYIEPGLVPKLVVNSHSDTYCLYQLLNCEANVSMFFTNNFAANGGNDIYGASVSDALCSNSEHCNITFDIASSSNSSVSSDALRVCMCDDHGKPRCENDSFTLMHRTVCPGEIFTVSAVLVGGDFGLTTGMIHANIYSHSSGYSIPPSLALLPAHNQIINSIAMCNILEYSIYSVESDTSVVVYFSSLNLDSLLTLMPENSQCGSESSCFLTAPVFINFTILPCPPGFTLLTDDPPHCDCYGILTKLEVSCQIRDGFASFSWTGSLWISIDRNGTVYNKYCPHNYCINGSKLINLQTQSEEQCDFNRTGRLCGKCQENYTLAIGSSRCIYCPNNNNLALLIFFIAAGFMLVFLLAVLNLTVTQGMINGLIFYANIVWTYKDVFLVHSGPSNAVEVFLETFIAWINLDFGIETCFVKGLTAFWKISLQFIFPFYIWAIACLIIVTSRHSSKLTNLLGHRALPLLATLFLLSYMKLLRTAVSILEFSVLHQSESHQGLSSIIVWSVDGSLTYFESPHIILWVAGIITLLLLWLPYTLLLFTMQWLRRLPQLGPLKWIMRLHPLYDAYFAPLKYKHQYWFGLLLLARGILLVTFASTFAIPRDINLLLLLITGILLVYYMFLTHPYKCRAVLILYSCYLVNLTLLTGFFFFTYTQPNGSILQSIAVGLSTGAAFLQFCGTVLYATIVSQCFRKRKLHEESEHTNIGTTIQRQITSNGYRDSILNETEPLINNAETY